MRILEQTAIDSLNPRVVVTVKMFRIQVRLFNSPHFLAVSLSKLINKLKYVFKLDADREVWK